MMWSAKVKFCALKASLTASSAPGKKEAWDISLHASEVYNYVLGKEEGKKAKASALPSCQTERNACIFAFLVAVTEERSILQGRNE